MRWQPAGYDAVTGAPSARRLQSARKLRRPWAPQLSTPPPSPNSAAPVKLAYSLLQMIYKSEVCTSKHINTRTSATSFLKKVAAPLLLTLRATSPLF